MRSPGSSASSRSTTKIMTTNAAMRDTSPTLTTGAREPSRLSSEAPRNVTAATGSAGWGRSAAGRRPCTMSQATHESRNRTPSMVDGSSRLHPVCSPPSVAPPASLVASSAARTVRTTMTNRVNRVSAMTVSARAITMATGRTTSVRDPPDANVTPL